MTTGPKISQFLNLRQYLFDDESLQFRIRWEIEDCGVYSTDSCVDLRICEEEEESID